MTKTFASKSIMIVGTSMIQRAYSVKYMGFGIGLSDWYSRLADIFLRGQSGYNSRWILTSLPELIGSQKPDMAILFLGNNDSVTSKGVQSVPVEEFHSNVVAIMRTFRSVNPDVTFLLLTPTRATKVGRIDSVTAKYVMAVREIGEHNYRTAVVELWDMGIGKLIRSNDEWTKEVRAILTCTVTEPALIPEEKLKSLQILPREDGSWSKRLGLSA